MFFAWRTNRARGMSAGRHVKSGLNSRPNLVHDDMRCERHRQQIRREEMRAKNATKLRPWTKEDIRTLKALAQDGTAIKVAL
jgi:hypothetical protein